MVHFETFYDHLKKKRCIGKKCRDGVPTFRKVAARSGSILALTISYIQAGLRSCGTL